MDDKRTPFGQGTPPFGDQNRTPLGFEASEGVLEDGRARSMSMVSIDVGDVHWDPAGLSKQCHHPGPGWPRTKSPGSWYMGFPATWSPSTISG
jgi:hypothetical protein